MTDNGKLKKLFGRLKGLEQSLPSFHGTVDGIICDGFNKLVGDVSLEIGENLDDYQIPREAYNSRSSRDAWCYPSIVTSKVMQFRSYLEYGFHLSESVIEIGALYKSIADDELRSRCADILSAPGNFDRPINQATQVLEDRIRQKSQADRAMTGVPLVNHAINSDPSKSLLVISDVKEEHEGIAHICRGIMLAFRNPTHHQISDKFSREDALSVVGFVDRLLRLIDGAKRN